MSQVHPWWQSAVFYQIYPRSFADGNGDGVGDLPGMTEKLDYLHDLGVDAIWLSPHYPSPNVDCGYDISDYQAVAPEYGTLEDFKLFLDGLHKRGMYLVLDMVLNHTSDRHPWFVESRSSRNSPKRDWYIWKPGKDGQAPTNWYSTFGGSAWEFDKATGEYYYHYFFKEQPDLNWHNPNVKKAMFDAMRFWLDLGVDGFRLDAIGTIYEDERYLNHPARMTQEEMIFRENSAPTPDQRKELAKIWQEMFQFQHDMPGVHELMKELRGIVEEYPERVLIGETDDIAFYGKNNDELHLNFNFPLMWTKKMTSVHIHENQVDRLSRMPKGAWPCNTLGNHDSPRMYNNFGDGIHDDLLARLNLMLLLTLKGTPFLYNGEEIGMTDYPFADESRFRDSSGKFIYNLMRTVFHLDEHEAARKAGGYGRDKCRTPFQWSAAENAGFSPPGIEPWLPINPNFKEGVNFADEQRTPNSLWQYYRALLNYRKINPVFQLGDYSEVECDAPETFSFQRSLSGQSMLILLNYSNRQMHVPLQQPAKVAFLSKESCAKAGDRSLDLDPFTGAICSF